MTSGKFATMLSGLTREDLSAPERLLVVNAESSAGSLVVRVTSVAEGDTPEGGFDAALWECKGELLPGLRVLRGRVRPGGLVVVGVKRRNGALQLVRRLFARNESAPPAFDELCAAPMLAGLAEPHVLSERQGGSIVAARVPEQLDSLDRFFAQPA